MDLFENRERQWQRRQGPLAARFRPRTMDEMVGQDHIVGPGRLLRRAAEADRLTSAVFWGPPGTGKTTLAMIIASMTESHFESSSAVTVGVSQVRQKVQEARERLRVYEQRTILFLDEIHRFNRAQQDVLLPHVEEGIVVLLGATTENPFFTLNSALLSRSRVFRLKPLAEDDIVALLQSAVSDRERGLGHMDLQVDPEAMRHWARMADGDARSALNALELAALSTQPSGEGRIYIDLEAAQESIQRKALKYDREGDSHYDTISAFIKSVRGSDPEAALYWLARMLEAGEDPRFIARRLMILASEDIGLADSRGLLVAVAAAQCLDRVGLPEGRIPLAHATVYLALTDKSNSAYQALGRAEKEVSEGGAGEVPLHLRNPAHPALGEMGHGREYLYPHDHPGHHVSQEYLPGSLEGSYFSPGKEGEEAELVGKWLQRLSGLAPEEGTDSSSPSRG